MATTGSGPSATLRKIKAAYTENLHEKLKDKDLEEILTMYELPEDAFTAPEVTKLEPDKWKNVGMSVVDAVLCLRDA